MNRNMTPTGGDAQNSRLSAWLDGELDTDGAQAMSELVTSDETLAARAQRMSRIDDLVRAAVPEEPVPDALLERLGLSAPAAAPSAEIVDLSAVRRQREEHRRAAAPAARPRLLWRIAAQVAVIGRVGVAAALWFAPHGASVSQSDEYRTLSNHPQVSAPAVNAVVIFGDAVDPAAAHRIAGAAGANLIGTPNAAGAWKAAIAPGRRDDVLSTLRADPRVAGAEPIDGANR